MNDPEIGMHGERRRPELRAQPAAACEDGGVSAAQRGAGATSAKRWRCRGQQWHPSRMGTAPPAGRLVDERWPPNCDGEVVESIHRQPGQRVQLGRRGSDGGEQHSVGGDRSASADRRHKGGGVRGRSAPARPPAPAGLPSISGSPGAHPICGRPRRGGFPHHHAGGILGGQQ